MNMKKALSCLLILAMLFVMIPMAVFADEDTGAATLAGDPIISADELKAMDSTKTYYLANDITISGDWKYVKFCGILDGNGHTVYLADGASLDAGLFHQLGSKSDVTTTTIVKNLNIVQLGKSTFKNSNVGNHQRDLGFLAGRAYGKVTIENVTVKGNLSGLSGNGNIHAGGLVGNMRNGNFTVKNCVFSGTFPTSESKLAVNAGGIVGSFSDNDKLNADYATFTISNCVVYGSVYGTSSAGGILGTGQQDKNPFYALTIEKCVNYADITCKSKEQAGGIAGYLCYYGKQHKDSSGGSAPLKLELLNNINFGDVISLNSGDKVPGGIVGNLKIWSATSTITISGNVNNRVISGNKAGPIVANAYGGGSDSEKGQDDVSSTWKNSENLTVKYNYTVAGGTYTSDSNYPADTDEIGASTLEELNAAYPNTYAMDGGKISLKWAVDAGYSYMMPTMIGCQTKVSSGVYSFRFAAGVDADIAKYGQSIGFSVVAKLTKADGTTETKALNDVKCSCVWTSFMENDTDEYKQDGSYFALLTVEGVSADEYSAVEFTVTPNAVVEGSGAATVGTSAIYTHTLTK